MICDQWDVAVAPFPFTDLAFARKRPALVLSTEWFNIGQEHTILAMITTARASAWPTDHRIADTGSAGLRTPCVVRWKIFTLDNRILQARIGRLSEADIVACQRVLGEVLGRR